MRKRILNFSIFILFGFTATINAQKLHKLKPDSFYQEWSLVSINTQENLRIYKSKKITSSETSNNSSSVLQFKKRNRVFYFINPNPNSIHKEGALDWTKPIKKVPIKRGICGNEFFGKKKRVKNYSRTTRYSKKGVWKVYSKNDAHFLVLKYLVSTDNTGYVLSKKEEFQIVSLKEDKMILRKE